MNMNIAPVTTFQSDEEAIALASDSEYGLSLSIICSIVGMNSLDVPNEFTHCWCLRRCFSGAFLSVVVL